MMYVFDKVINRRVTESFKWNVKRNRTACVGGGYGA